MFLITQQGMGIFMAEVSDCITKGNVEHMVTCIRMCIHVLHIALHNCRD